MQECQPRSLRVVVIGAGNVARSLAVAILKSEHLELSAVYNRTREKWDTFLVNKAHHCFVTSEIDKIPTDRDLYIIAVSDNAIASIAESLPDIQHGVVVHTSGATPMDVLERFPHRGVLYPPNTFSHGRIITLEGSTLFVEQTTPEAQRAIQSFCRAVRAEGYEANSSQRVGLHIAAVFANNFVNALYGIAQEILKEHKLPQHALDAIILETAQKIRTLPPKEAQTGPAQRGDSQTIERHLGYLSSTSSSHPIRQQIYSLLTQYIQDINND